MLKQLHQVFSPPHDNIGRKRLVNDIGRTILVRFFTRNHNHRYVIDIVLLIHKTQHIKPGLLGHQQIQKQQTQTVTVLYKPVDRLHTISSLNNIELLLKYKLYHLTVEFCIIRD